MDPKTFPSVENWMAMHESVNFELIVSLCWAVECRFTSDSVETNYTPFTSLLDQPTVGLAPRDQVLCIYSCAESEVGRRKTGD